MDFRCLNNLTVKDAFPLPRIEECLDFLGEILSETLSNLSTLDMASDYWQVEIAEADRSKTASITKYGLFEHKRCTHLCPLACITWAQKLALICGAAAFVKIIAESGASYMSAHRI